VALRAFFGRGPFAVDRFPVTDRCQGPATLLRADRCRSGEGGGQPIAGALVSLHPKDGTGTGAPSPRATVGPDGKLYICEVENHRVLRLDMDSGQVETVAGNGTKGYSGDGGKGTEAQLNEPYEIRFDSQGNLYFNEMMNHLIRKVDMKTGEISTVAGTGEEGFGGDDGPALKAKFSKPHSIVIDEADKFMYVADIGNHRIRRIDLQSGTIETIAGTGERTLPQDGQQARGNPMLGPRALFLTGDILWIALREGHSVWKLELTSGRLTHIAGSGKKGFSGDRGPAKEATMNGPKGIALGPDGMIYVVDTENQTIRQIDLEKSLIYTVAGKGPAARGGKGDDGPATEAEMDRPHGIGIGPDNALYIGDTNNHRVRKVVPVRQQ
jgi:sugar lactone lactonase YvrE